MHPQIILLLILTAFLWGLTPVIEKKALQTASPFAGLVIRNFAVTLILVIVILLWGKTREILTMPSRTMFYFAASGVIAGLLAMITYFTALKLGATSKIVPISATYPLITAFICILFLGEQVTLLRILGTILIISGVYLVKIS
ncbi:MAG: EamA family transporter [Planctomycetota bacterium]|nr:EamA family transporter [Planctomycetota bacterium]MDI6787394.1 EamA family transporter [Planctomycetota bacterium]